MINWSLSGEYLGLVLIFIIALFYADTKPIRGMKKRYYLYWFSLGLCALSIFLNIYSVHIMDTVHSHSIGLAMAVNTAYFLVSWAMVMVLCYYLFGRLLEFVYDGHCTHRINTIQIVLIVFSVALLAYNVHSGVIFSFNEARHYCRGPLNWLCYVVPCCEIAMLIMCYIKNRRSVSDVTQKVLFISVPIALILIAYQFAFPDQELNGLIYAIVNLVIFISYNGGRGEKDSLTGLENRRYFLTEVEFLTKSKMNYQVIFVKLHSLPQFSNAYGDASSDLLILRIAEALEKIDEHGKVFKYASSGFAMLFTDSDPVVYRSRLYNTAQAMQQLVKTYPEAGTVSHSVIEIRYAGQDWNIDDIHNYISDAVQIGATHQIQMMPFDDSIIRERQRKDAVYALLCTALEEKRLQVWYQPIYYFATDDFRSAEALLRMYDRDGNLVFPSEFIPIAEETGIIDDMTIFVVENVCRLLKSNTVPQLEAISINFSVRQITDEEFLRRVRLVMKRYETKPEQIRIEITETDASKCDDDITASMFELKEKGYQFMMDDFGTGYSNISRMTTLPLDFIKIDRSVVLMAEKDEKQFSILKYHLIPLFIKLGCKIVAEGVESKETSDLLANCGVDAIQGYYYAKPMPEHKLVVRFDRH